MADEILVDPDEPVLVDPDEPIINPNEPIVVSEDDPVVLEPNDTFITMNRSNTSVSDTVNAALTTPHSLFIVNGTLDLTGNISVPTYKVNLLNKYEEWTDNNKVDHRDIHSKKIEGNFELVFFSPEEYYTLMATLKNGEKSSGAIDCSVYCNNTMEVYNVEMFVDTEPSNIVPYLGQYKEYERLTVEVKQRGAVYVSS